MTEHTNIFAGTTFNINSEISSNIPSMLMGFPGGSDGKESTCNAGDLGLIPELGRSPGEENSSPLQYSCLENSTDSGAWLATVHGVEKRWTQLRDFHFHYWMNI